MPCNLGISVTKAAVNNATLAALLTPEAIQAVMTPEMLPILKNLLIKQTNDGVVVSDWGEMRFQVFVTAGGKIERRTPPYNVNSGQDIEQAGQALLAQAADVLLGEQVKAALAAYGQVKARVAQVEENGALQVATVITLNI